MEPPSFPTLGFGEPSVLQSPELDEAYQTAHTSTPIPWFIRLWAAVVRRATVDFVLYKGHESSKLRKIGADAEHWIFADSEEDISAFIIVCEILDLDPDMVRSKITNLGEDEARSLRGMEFGDDW